LCDFLFKKIKNLRFGRIKSSSSEIGFSQSMLLFQLDCKRELRQTKKKKKKRQKAYIFFVQLLVAFSVALRRRAALNATSSLNGVILKNVHSTIRIGGV
jgi:hypothetical protein